MNSELGRGKRHVVDALFTLALFCVFALTCLLVVHIGSQVYRATIDAARVGFEVNTPLTYVSTKIRQHDSAGRVQVARLGDTDALVLEQELGGRAFQTWIYHHDGALWELFVSRGSTAGLTPGAGQQLLPVEQFSVRWAGEGLLYISAQSECGIHAGKLVGIRSL